MCFQVSALDLTDIKVLEDQLVGVDSAYFSMLINALAPQANEKGSLEGKEPYVLALIDRIF